PVSGIKVDLAKPEATVSATFPSKKNPGILIGFDLKAGVTDKTFSIFKGLSDFNTAFELKPALHIIPSWNSAWYLPSQSLLAKAKNENVLTHFLVQQDTFYAAAIVYNKHLASFGQLIDKTKSLPDQATITDRQKSIVIH